MFQKEHIRQNTKDDDRSIEMPQFINTNVASINTVRVLDKSQAALQTSMERLSSGMRINHARDDAAGLAISEGMTSQIRGMNQAVRNTMDGISLVQTADGAMQGITEKLQRVRELAVQSANGTNSTNDRAALDLEVQALLNEVDRVAGAVEFNGNKLLDGNFTNKAFQVSHTQGDTINISSIQNSTLNGLSLSVSKAEGLSAAFAGGTAAVAGGDLGNGALADGNIILNGTGIDAIAKDADARTIASTINLKTSTSGVTATATKSDIEGQGTGAVAISSVKFKINDTEVEVASVTNTAAGRDTGLADLASAINAKTGSTGVTAKVVTGTGAAGTDKITLEADDGRTIKITDLSADEDTFTGITEDAIGIGGLKLSADKDIVMTDAAGDGTQLAKLGLTEVTIAAGGANKVAVDTVSNANDTITRVDAALKSINTGRANLGAYQNRFEATVSDLKNNVENLSGARSRIQDADFAEETAALAKNQILQQAGMAMLAQANQLPQNVLSLLR